VAPWERLLKTQSCPRLNIRGGLLLIEENATMFRQRNSNRVPIGFDEVKRAALVDIRGVLGRFLPGGKAIRGEYVVLNPTRPDKHPGSFCINLKSGEWADFATHDRGRDLISLTAYVKNISQYEAARGLSQMLGVGARR
jgi:hypothetical protein